MLLKWVSPAIECSKVEPDGEDGECEDNGEELGVPSDCGEFDVHGLIITKARSTESFPTGTVDLDDTFLRKLEKISGKVWRSLDASRPTAC